MQTFFKLFLFCSYVYIYLFIYSFIYLFIRIYTYRLPGSLWKVKDGPMKKLNRKGRVALPGQYGQSNLGEAPHLQRQICPAKKRLLSFFM